MQTFNLDLSKKGVIPLLNAKQRDVGTKILINITDNGKEYAIPADASFSVWYSGKSGEGNYTTINGASAFAISGNTVTVELIMQMLNNPGEHVMCLVMNGSEGSQLGLWNIPYYVEAIPGADSEIAQQYYQAFVQAQKKAEEAAQVADDAKELAIQSAQTATDAAARAEQVVASVDQVTLEQMRELVVSAENLSAEAADAATRAENDATRAERAAESVDMATLEQMQELIAGAENLSAEAADAAERAEKAAGDAEDSAYNKQNKLAWATDEDIDAMFDGTYEGVENEDPEGDGYLPEGGGGSVAPLIVTLSEDESTASHTSVEIHQAAQNNQNVWLEITPGLYFPLLHRDEYCAVFGTFWDGTSFKTYSVYDDASVEPDEEHFVNEDDISAFQTEEQVLALIQENLPPNGDEVSY